MSLSSNLGLKIERYGNLKPNTISFGLFLSIFVYSEAFLCTKIGPIVFLHEIHQQSIKVICKKYYDLKTGPVFRIQKMTGLLQFTYLANNTHIVFRAESIEE